MSIVLNVFTFPVMLAVLYFLFTHLSKPLPHQFKTFSSPSAHVQSLLNSPSDALRLRPTVVLHSSSAVTWFSVFIISIKISSRPMNYLTVLFGFQMYGYVLAGFELLFPNSLLTAYFQILSFFPPQDFLCDPLCMWPI